MITLYLGIIVNSFFLLFMFSPDPAIMEIVGRERTTLPNPLVPNPPAVAPSPPAVVSRFIHLSRNVTILGMTLFLYAHGSNLSPGLPPYDLFGILLALVGSIGYFLLCAHACGLITLPFIVTSSGNFSFFLFFFWTHRLWEIDP